MAKVILKNQTVYLENVGQFKTLYTTGTVTLSSGEVVTYSPNDIYYVPEGKIIDIGNGQATIDTLVFPTIDVDIANEIYETYANGVQPVLFWDVVGDMLFSVLGADKVAQSQTVNNYEIVAMIHEKTVVYSWTSESTGDLTPTVKDYVDLTSAQTISGVKTFSNGIKTGVIGNTQFDDVITLLANGNSRVRGIEFRDANGELGTSSRPAKNAYIDNLSDGTNSVAVADIATKSEIPDVDGLATKAELLSGLSAKIGYSDIVNNTITADANKPLSANVGKELNDRITNLASIGHYLAMWDCTTGLPTTNPTTLPYTYTSGDYYIIKTLGTTNYMPNGASYTGSASTTAYSGTETLEVNDFFYYDGSTWSLLKNTGRSVTFGSIAGSPMDNSNLASALNGKLDKSSTPRAVYGTDNSGNQSLLGYTDSATGWSIAQRNGDGNMKVGLTPTDNAHATSKSYVDTALSGKQDASSAITKTMFSLSGTTLTITTT